MAEPMVEHLFKNLPGIYREGGQQSYTYRLTSLFADVLEELEDEVDGIHNLLNAQETPAKFLSWLASWVALELDETWSEEKRRDLIGKIVHLYKWRGTIEGIKTFVEIYTGISPQIVEPFRSGWRIGVVSTVGQDTKIFQQQEDPHCFSVLVNSFEPLTTEEKQKVMAVVEIEKPAHTKVIHYGWLDEFWLLGLRSTVGIDMKVGG